MIKIKGFDDYYFNNKYQVVSTKRGAKYILTPTLNKRGYEIITLYKNKKQHKMGFHRLLAKTFIPNPENKPEVNHINGIRNDNNILNLEWVTCKENMTHAYDNGLINPAKGEKIKASKLKKEDIPVIRERLSHGEYCSEICKDYGVHKTSINNIRINKTWSHI